MFDTAIMIHYIFMILAGSVIGMIPAVYAVKMERTKMALVAFIYCAVGAMIGIWVSFILAAGFGAAIYNFQNQNKEENQIDLA